MANILGQIIIQNPDAENQVERVSKIFLKMNSQTISIDKDKTNFNIPADFIFNYD